MKKATLLLAGSLLAFGASAQWNQQRSPVTAPFAPKFHHAAQPYNEAETANKGAANPNTRWYNHAEALGTYNGVNVYDQTLEDFNYLWPDSTVRYPAPDQAFGIRDLSIAEVFNPQAALYNTNNTTNRGKVRINTEAYTVDSVMVRGYYNRTFNTYVDTLILTFVTETAVRPFAYLSFGGSTAANHGIDSAAAILFSGPDYGVKPINQVSYSISGASLSPAVMVKVPLNQATFIDSLPDGTHRIKAATSITVPGGRKTSMSVTYKPGTSYTSGSQITNYNHFYYLSHETQAAGFVFYPVGDQNMSYILTKDTNMVNATLGYYVPTLAFSNGSFAGEVHNISWKARCLTCSGVGVADVSDILNIGDAYPNPATSSITVPVTTKETANVSVALTNMVGQVVKTLELGKLTANQGINARINTAGLANGVYTLTVSANGQQHTSRVVINN